MKVVHDKEYNSIHLWINTNYGKANKCSNPDCKSLNPKRFEWALKKGCEYERNIDNFISLCPSCHRKYDYPEENREKQSIRIKEEYSSGKRIPPKSHKGKLGGNHPTSKGVDQYNIEGKFIKNFLSIREASSNTGISETSITNCLTNRSKTSGNYIWKYAKQRRNI